MLNQSSFLALFRGQNWSQQGSKTELVGRGRRGGHQTGDLWNGEPKYCYSLQYALFYYHLNSIDVLLLQRNTVKPQLLTSSGNSHCEHQAERGLRAWKPCISLTAHSIDLFPAQSGLQGRVEQGCVGAGWGRTWIDADSVHLGFRGSSFWPCAQAWACSLLATCALLPLPLDFLLLKSDNTTVKSKLQPYHMRRVPQFC